MKLYDLIGEVLDKPIPQIKKSTRSIKTNWDKNAAFHLPVIGTPGGQSVAFHHNTSDKVVKVSTLYTGEQDPIYQFIRMCLKHQDNPYFPKIHSVKQYPTGNDTEITFVMSMERLYSMELSDITTFLNLIHINPDDYATTDRDILSMFVKNKLDVTSIRQTIYKKTVDPELKKAMKLLEPLFRNFGTDMHFGNVMVRKTGQGSQLVFMDPITYG